MTLRWLGASYEPERPTVRVGYKAADGRKLEEEFEWAVFVYHDHASLVVVDQAVEIVFGTSDPKLAAERCAHVGIRLSQIWAKKLFALEDDAAVDPKRQLQMAVALKSLFFRFVTHAQLRAFTQTHPELTTFRLSVKSDDVRVIPSLLPDFIEARHYLGSTFLTHRSDTAAALPAKQRQAIGEKEFGYIRIRAFPLDDVKSGWFKYEFIRLLAMMPHDGLILDMRGNPGGSTPVAEECLQFLTPRQITPLPFRFAVSGVTKELAERFEPFREYAPYSS
jgi:hypothetical protein